MSEWTDYDPSIRRMLFIIMERSKRPVRLTAGKFVFLSIPTLVSVNNVFVQLLDLATYRFFLDI